ncbi:hypothetical protein L873DRAFT_1826293 [Choiromyces venosus 120613-1]|uniref:S-adenosyl-L-methionine-dependent methyltransferase n=1 Tax=Choiromyces venosus 120613-1 TaxID=1336337 RepID=A0A3N4K119_9PEZI|nr:hypothetical protein L873DRAFT_1826293 [Choiromyces venosus 120613-1]
MPLNTFLPLLHEIHDTYEGSLYPAKPPSQNLGFLSPTSPSITISIGSRDLTIQQSPGILSSTRSGGTTGAVLWKVTPLFANYLSTAQNPFFTHGVLSTRSSVLELGCGISGVLGLTLGGRVRGYFLSDQGYVLKLLRRNLEENTPPPARRGGGGGKKGGNGMGMIKTLALDWEKDRITREHPVLKEGVPFDAVIACDCIYNESLVDALVETLDDACRELSASPRDDTLSQAQEGAKTKPTLVIIVQELRSQEVFETWLERFHKSFHTYRIPDSLLTTEINSSSGYSIHVGILRD